jgi:hypothetical protein
MTQGWALAYVTCFVASRLNHPIISHISKPCKGIPIVGKDPRQSHQRSPQATLVALKEFRQYLESLEKDLSRRSKQYSNREIAQGVGFVAAGIHEALNYLEIVKKVIEKTERAVAKANAVSEDAAI